MHRMSVRNVFVYVVWLIEHSVERFIVEWLQINPIVIPNYISLDAQFQDNAYILNVESFLSNRRYKTLFFWLDNKKGTQTSFPLDVMLALWGIREDLQAAADTLTQLAGPPSPPLVS